VAAENKSEKATGRQRQKARDKGQVARSRDLVTALTLLTATFVLAWEPHVWIDRWRGLLTRLLDAGTASEIGLGTPILSWTALTVAWWIAPVLALSLCTAIFSTAMQGGFVFAAEALKPNWGRLNPANNVKQLFSMAGLSRILRSLIPAAAILYISAGLIERELPRIVYAERNGSRELLTRLGSILFELSWKSGLVLLIWAGADYAFQHWNFEKSLKMTKQEVKQELKDTDGNPAVRGRMRRLRKTMFKKMMAKDLARATAVITNPTHYAVAIEYRPGTMSAPVVVAKGRNLIAERIKQLARWNEIPIVENPSLARALFKATEVGQAIPPKLYEAVAELLAFLYRTQSRLQLALPQAKTGARI
jgi:flagellar biosynthesis protein FlhB